MLIEPFQPAPGGSTTCAVTTSDAFFAIPGDGECLELNNLTTGVVYIESDGITPATVANSYPIAQGQCKVIKRWRGAGTPGIRAIAAVAGNLIVSVGNGL
jgi:hypothetical protein